MNRNNNDTCLDLSMPEFSERSLLSNNSWAGIPLA